MKKLQALLIAAVGAAAAFAASAATLSSTSGTTFAGLTAGDAFSASGAAAEGGKYYWYSADAQSGTNMSLAANYYGGACGRPNQFAEAETSIALAVDAENLLYRAAEGSASAFSSPSFTQVDLGDGGLYIDTLIKFEQCRDEADIADDAGKLAVWLNSTSNLVITAGKYSGSIFQSTNNYVISQLASQSGLEACAINPDAWYRLTVNAVTNAYNILEFRVYIDGKQAIDGNYTSVFPSLQPSSSTLSALAFQGIGAVDDISFTEELPNFLFVGVAQIGDTYYATLDDALAAVNYGQTIMLLADPGVTSVTLPKTGIALSDPNGYLSTVTGPNGQEVAASENTYSLPLTAVNPVTGETENYTWSFVGTDTWNGTGNWRNSSGANPSGTPAKTGENTWDPILFDGSNININASMSVEGWNLRMGLYNGATVTMNNFVKYQGDTTMWMTVDEKSQLTVGGFGGGNITANQVIKLSVAKANGITWNANLTSGNANNTFEYYLKGAGSVSYQAISAANHKIKMADVTLSGNEKSVQSKTLVSFTSSTPTFTADAVIKVKNSSDEVVRTVNLSSVNSTGTTTLTTDNAVGTCELVQTSTGIVLFWVDGDPSDIKEYKPSININFTNGAGNGLTTSDDVGLSGYDVPGTSWNNYVVANSTFSTVNAIDSTGTASVMPGVNVTISSVSGSWSCSGLTASSDIRQSYIDESASYPTPTVTVSGIPYYKYRVIVYHSTDTAGVPFGYDTINGTNYTYVNDALAEGTTEWGNSGAKDSANAISEGGNVLVTEALSGSTLTVVGHRAGGVSNARGCIAAIQIIEVKPEAGEGDLIIEVSGATTYTVDANATYTTVYATGTGTLSFSGSGVITTTTFNIGNGVTMPMDTTHLSPATVTGSGTIVYDGSQPSTTLGFNDSDNWFGTVWVKNIGSNGESSKVSTVLGTDTATATGNVLKDWGNENSSVKFTNVRGWTGTAVCPWTLILEDDSTNYAWYNNNGYAARSTTFAALKGSGTFYDKSVDNKPCRQKITFTDGSQFTGALYAEGKRVGLGGENTRGDAEDNNGTIEVVSGATATVASGKTWTAGTGSILVTGTLYANGTLAGTSTTRAVRGSGTVVFTGSAPSPTGDAWWKNSAWTGTVELNAVTAIAGWEFNNYGHSGSTLRLNNCRGWLKNNYTCAPALEIGGTFTWNDGSSGLNNTFKVGTLKGSGTISIPTGGAPTAVWQITDDWSGFKGAVVGNNTDGRRVLVFGPTLPATVEAGEIYISAGATLNLGNASATWWTRGKGFVVDGTVVSPNRDKWGGGTAMTLGDTGVLELTSTANVNDASYGNNPTSADLSGITGTGTLKYSSSAGWRAFPDVDSRMPASTLTIQTELADSLIITKNNGETVIGSLAGTKNIRSDFGSNGDDGRTLTVTQSKDTEWQGKFVLNRITQFNVNPGASTTGTLTLSGTHTVSIPLTVSGSVNLTGTWVGATTVSGTIGGTGTLTGNLTFNAGSTFKAFASDENGLSVSGSIAYPASGTVTVDVSALVAPAAKVVLLTAASESDIDLSKFALADGTDSKCKLTKEGATLVVKWIKKKVLIIVK